MATVHQVTDHIIIKLAEAKLSLSPLKLQKLLYYVQAWSLAVRREKVFPNKFQAWIHGPVCREVFDRFKDTHMLYDNISPANDMRESAAALSEDTRAHVDEVLAAYGELTGIQLENMTHDELPWQKAREGYAPAARCEVEIDEDLMASYYAKMLADVEQEQANA